MQIILLDGRTVDTADILFDPAALANGNAPVFSLAATGEDLDNNIRQTDMSNFPGWDQTQWLYWRSAHPTVSGAGAYTGPALPTNVTGITATQLFTDPLAAPAEALSNTGNAVKGALKAPTTYIGLAVVAVLALYLFEKA